MGVSRRSGEKAEAQEQHRDIEHEILRETGHAAEIEAAM